MLLLIHLRYVISIRYGYVLLHTYTISTPYIAIHYYTGSDRSDINRLSGSLTVPDNDAHASPPCFDRCPIRYAGLCCVLMHQRGGSWSSALRYYCGRAVEAAAEAECRRQIANQVRGVGGQIDLLKVGQTWRAETVVCGVDRCRQWGRDVTLAIRGVVGCGERWCGVLYLCILYFCSLISFSFYLSSCLCSPSSGSPLSAATSVSLHTVTLHTAQVTTAHYTLLTLHTAQHCTLHTTTAHCTLHTTAAHCTLHTTHLH
jgi:hypothetical protein